MANSVVRLSIDSHEFDANIKRAGEALNKFFDQAKKGDRTFEVLDDDAMEVVKTFGKMETSSKSARGQLSELTKGFTDLSLIYKRLTDEEKTSPVGKEMAKSLGELKTRIQNTKKDLADINQELSGSKFGQFGGIIDGIGHKMGVSANLTELLTSKTALMTTGIGAAVAVIGKATEAWASYNAELAKQDQQAQVVTGLKGEDANRMSDAARALADTYNVDFRQAIEAANTLMAQFGRSGDEAIQLLRDGLQGMVLGDGQKLLSMIQQYGPAFQSAGVSASQLVAVIQNSEGGIFTDQNMQAIVMGIKNIRLMTKQTSDALSQLGIDGNKMSEQLNNGTLTVFDALKQVANELKGVDSNSKAAGEVMQAVFGRQGAMAGTNIAKAIEGLNTNLAETKRQTGELGAAYADLELANERLNSAIRDCFEYDGWEQMTTGIKTGLLNALSEVLEISIKIKNSWVGELGATIFDKLSSAALETTGIFGRLLNLIRGIKEEAGDTAAPENVGKEGAVIARVVPERIMRPSKEASDLKNTDAGKRKDVHKQNIERYDAQIAEQKNVVKENKKRFGETSMVPAIQEVIDEEKKKLQELQDMRKSYIQKAETILNPPKSPNKPDPKKSDPNKPSTPKTETKQNEAAIAKLTDEYQKLATATKTADDAQKAGMTERMTAIQGEIKTLQDRNAELKKFADEAKGVKVSVDVPNSLPQLTQQLKDLQQAQSQSLDTREWVEYQKQIDVTTTKIDILKGKWKEGQVATFSISVNNSEAYDLLKNLEGVNIDEETITVTADTAEAYNKVQELIGGIEGTSVSFEVQPQVKPLPTLDDYRIQAMIEIDAQNAKADTETLMSILRDSLQKGIDTTGLDLTPIAEQIGQGVDVKDEKWQAILDKYNELRTAIGEEPIQINFDTGKMADAGKATEFAWKDAAGAVKMVGSALSNIQDPAVKIASTIGMAIANIALAYSDTLAKDIGSKTNIFAFIGAAASAMISMVSTIATIHSSTGFAEGGIVPGNSYSGDNLHTVDYGINAGELILNRAQQSTIAEALTTNDNQWGGQSAPYVTGEKIVLGINNWGKATGKGQLVFSRG